MSKDKRRRDKRKLSSHRKGLELEKRVASWLKRNYGLECKIRDLVRGKAVKRPYEVDVHAIKKGWFSRKDIWVECKATKVKRTHVIKLIASAQDVCDAYEEGISEWCPSILMIVSNVGFDLDAIGWANKYGVYCVLAGSRSFKFEGDMTREDFEDLEISRY